MKNFFQRTGLDLVFANKIFSSIEEIGITLGLDPDTINPMNAQRRIKKVASEYIKFSEKANELGYSSVAMALKALSQVKENAAPVDLSSLPEVFHKLPSIWLDGKPNRGNKKGFVRLTVAQAEREHRRIVPLLIEAWHLAEDYDNIRDQITRQYLTTWHGDFEAALYKFIHELEEVSIEEELQDWELDPSIVELMSGLKAAQAGRDYGVGGNLDEVSWE